MSLFFDVLSPPEQAELAAALDTLSTAIEGEDQT
jgi:hypothetical protein